ncbi:GFA family protein [Kiloniella litopenaei]|uniref:GFA family protein n=1 Tax=Kiloniella litopenaei TaxID=1549748 RepID=UPI0009E53819|nr:GFA family protein [Kiloniella litopenaei]
MIVGSCLCKTVTFEISGEFNQFFLCHCSRCQKGTGTAHAANLFSTTAVINWSSGQEKIKTYRVPETQHSRSFCSVCGSAVPNMQMGGELLVVPAGSLDSDISIRPNAHICMSSRATWDRDLVAIPKVDHLP